MPKKQEIVIDTSAFFAGTKKLRSYIGRETKLSTIDLVIFEFTKAMETEIARAEGSGRTRRLELLRGLRDRFPGLLQDLEIEVRSPEFSSADVGRLYSMLSDGGCDSGDTMIWLKMQRVGLHTILTDNVSNWERLGAKVVDLG